MLPASSLEKFVSMFLYCAIVTPIVVFFGGWLVDAFLSIFPFGGFEKPIHLYTINDFVHMMDNSEGVVQSGNMELSFGDVFPIGVMRTSLYMGIIQWAAIFMLGNMLFKKHKAGKTLVCYMGISYVFSTIFGLAFITSGRLQHWFETLKNYSEAEMIRVANNTAIWSMVIGIIILVLLLYFTYRKIKTQKY